MANASLWFYSKEVQDDLLVEMVIWRLPRPTEERPHGYKYRLYLGRNGNNLVRYDNETGKGDHRHWGESEAEERYAFSDLDSLIADFQRDCEEFGWRWPR